MKIKASVVQAQTDEIAMLFNPVSVHVLRRIPYANV